MQNEFNKTGYQIVHSAISKETASILATEFHLLKDNCNFLSYFYPNEFHLNGDEQVPESFTYYSMGGFESLLVHMKDKIEGITGKELFPCYSYARLYYNGAELHKHLDRKSCQYSATMTIELDKPWDIWIKGLDDIENAVNLNVGDMLVYRGDILQHWREKYEGTSQLQVFLHYVDVNGVYVDQKYDTRPMLGLPIRFRNEDLVK